jgi:hypothetical protein
MGALEQLTLQAMFTTLVPEEIAPLAVVESVVMALTAFAAFCAMGLSGLGHPVTIVCAHRWRIFTLAVFRMHGPLRCVTYYCT